MMLVGKTGAGKSATGNTLLRKKVFRSEISSAAVTTECQKETAKFRRQTLAVIDTPGLFDTKMISKEVKREIGKCISFTAPGPHVFLVVIQLHRFTEEEQHTLKLIQKLFGEEVSKYFMVLFTHGDDLKHEGKSIETFINENPNLDKFIRQCHGGYHVFNNRLKNPKQVRQLLKKIHLMVENNGGSYFTNEKLQEAESAITEEMERLRKENSKLKQKGARRQAERENTFIESFSIIDTRMLDVEEAVAPTSVGTGIGAKVGAAAAVERVFDAGESMIGVAVETVAGTAVGTETAAKVGAVAGTAARALAEATTLSVVQPAVKVVDSCISQ